ncbi:MAG: YihY/virulence factor BrkB family protein [Cyanobium sp.]
MAGRDPDRAFGLRRALLRPLWSAYTLWLRADCVDLSAAFAYHTLQSFLPALLIILSFVSRFLGRDQDLLEHLQQQMALLLPPASLPFFIETLQRFTRQGFGAGVLGVLLLVFSANNIYLTLQRGADRLWWNRPFDQPHLPWYALVRRFILLRLKAFVLLLMISLLITLDQLISNLRFFGFKVLRQWLIQSLPDSLQWLVTVSGGVDVVISLFIGCIIALLFLWLLPSRRIPLRPLLPSALLVGVSVTALNLVLGRVLVAVGLRFQAYGVVGGVLILTLWIWLTGVILYYGQCLGVVLASRIPRGGRSTPRLVF